MAHFFGSIQGQAGDATRIGSKRSGISAYVQSWTGRITIHMQHSEHEDSDIGCVILTPGPQGTGRGIDITGDVDATALVQAAEFDVETVHHLCEARLSVQRANAAALKAIAERDRLARKAA
jgi:hypothetical protein